MANYWIIKTTDTSGRSRYLTRVRPMQCSYEISNAYHFDDTQVKKACGWLVDMGVSHSVMQFSCV